MAEQPEWQEKSPAHPADSESLPIERVSYLWGDEKVGKIVDLVTGSNAAARDAYRQTVDAFRQLPPKAITVAGGSLRKDADIPEPEWTDEDRARAKEMREFAQSRRFVALREDAETGSQYFEIVVPPDFKFGKDE